MSYELGWGGLAHVSSCEIILGTRFMLKMSFKNRWGAVAQVSLRNATTLVKKPYLTLTLTLYYFHIMQIVTSVVIKDYSKQLISVIL